MKKYLGISLVVLALFAAFNAKGVNAAGYGYGQYQAPAPSENILIEKQVGTGAAKGGVESFVDNLSASDPRFSPGDIITFKLRVKNTSNDKLSDVVIRDFLPGSLEAPKGNGSIEDQGTFVIKVGALDVNQEKEFQITAKVKNQDRLPKDRGIICEVNKAEARSGKVRDEDTSQFCIEKEVPGKPKEVPQAGPAAGITLLIGQFGLLGTGIFLKKRSS